MNGPQLGSRREALPMNNLLEQNGGWSGLASMMGLAPQSLDPMQPSEAVCELLYVSSKGGAGKESLEWLLDITLRQPRTIRGSTIEEVAINAARRDAADLVGEMLLAAINRGEELIEAKGKTQ